ncbi:BTB/POZ domain-containing protein 16 [Trichoplax sp. H2]|nr:BTB/POZ domain-containing protein 16 [Trichoplax sp. H2]|eukprot:RDD43520.1 BTB/POZ domain-containing protein 16 [Trichoplax sp. H2]
MEALISSPTFPLPGLSKNNVSKSPPLKIEGEKMNGLNSSSNEEKRSPRAHLLKPVRVRPRTQVGTTNRWRFPESSGGDLLGTSQAVKSVPAIDDTPFIPIINYQTYSEFEQQNIPVDHEEVKPLPGIDGKFASGEETRIIKPTKSTYFIPKEKKTKLSPEAFHYHSRSTTSPYEPDVILSCLGTLWELHKPFLQRSNKLTALLEKAGDRSDATYTNRIDHNHDRQITSKYRAGLISGSEMNISSELPDHKRQQHDTVTKADDQLIKIKLSANDPNIDKEAFAIAICNLYRDDMIVDETHVIGVLAAAHQLQFSKLENKCAQVMLKSIELSNVAQYHQMATKCKQSTVAVACERWLEINLMPLMSKRINLRQLSLDLLHKIIQSPRFFTYNEYDVFKLVCVWIYLRENSSEMLMPTYATVVQYFESIPKNICFLLGAEGKKYTSIFQIIRYNGIIDVRHLDEIEKMNIFPQSHFYSLLHQHYHSLQNGGDMLLDPRIELNGIRIGFILQEEPKFHSELIALHGFYFEAKAIRQSHPNSYSFYMQRIRPTDNVLSYKECERQAFSVRPERKTMYIVRVQSTQGGNYKVHKTDMLTHNFSMTTHGRKSQVLTVDGLQLPVYVTFTIFFPQSD